MNYKSHLVAGIGCGVVVTHILGLNVPNTLIAVGTSGLFSLLPDVDTPHSFIGHKFRLTSWAVNRMFGHRTITHSLILPTISLCISPFYSSGIIYGVVVLSAYMGHISHILLDFMTPQGVPLLYPICKSRISLYKIFKMQ